MSPSQPTEDPAEITDPPKLITEPAGGIPFIVETNKELQRCAEELAAGYGPVAVDAERASGFRYGQRAFLVQLKRHGSQIWLIDPEAFTDLKIIQEALTGVEWILHAATQDLPCLYELGLWPDKLFDTELAGRLAGFPRVSLAALLERTLNITLAKEHSAADWSVRPLPEDLRTYAALDVEFLVQLRSAMIKELENQNKLDMAYQEFDSIRTRPLPQPRQDPWRRTSGLHSLRNQEQLAVVRELWNERDRLAQRRDVSPSRLLPDSALVAVAQHHPKTVPELLAIPKFSGRASRREAPRWLRAIQHGYQLDDADLPPLQVPTHAPPPPRVWPDRNPLAAQRLNTARSWLKQLAEKQNIPLENLLTPATLREICWRPPEPITPESVQQHLVELQARPWQIAMTAPVITVALLDPDPLPKRG